MSAATIDHEQAAVEDLRRRRQVPALAQWIIISLFMAGLVVTVLQVFMVVPMFTNFYLYVLLSVFLPPAFLLYPAYENSRRLPWYDVVLAIVTFAILLYLVANAFQITSRGWAFGAPSHYNYLCAALVIISLEAVRRVAGTVLCAFATFFAAYPLFADYMPGLLEGASFPVASVLNYHILSTDSLLGLPLQVVGTLVIGYLVFGVVMTFTGGGKFFLDLAFALFGGRMGGPAKVSVLSSGLFGSLSGSVISNVLTTGAFTIPAMKRNGYKAHYAAAVEACAATGGCLAPPVMGAVAFIMASILEVPYWDIVKAAAIPAVLYFAALFIQVHCYAGRRGILGMARAQLPELGPVLKGGWPYLLAFAVLVLFIYRQNESQAPFYASLVLLAVSVIQGTTKLHIREAVRLVEQSGLLIVEVTAVLVACGYILGSFAMTGLGSSFAREIVQLAGDVPLALLICGAIASYILGMGMTVTASYIFLAAILAPALVRVDFSLIASHLFVLYWGLSSFITPPVAIGTFVAAGLAGASPIRAGFTSMRIGMVLYIVPFLFIYEPVLVLNGSLEHLPRVLMTTLLALVLLAGGFEGYVPFFKRVTMIERSLLVVVAGLLLWPGAVSDLVGSVMVAAMAGFRLLRTRWWPAAPGDGVLSDVPDPGSDPPRR